MSVIETATEARQEEGGPSVLELLTTPSEPKVARYIHEQKLERYRRRIGESSLAMTRHRNRHDNLLRQLLEEEAKGQIELPLT